MSSTIAWREAQRSGIIETLDAHCLAIYLEVPGSKIVELQALVESYEGLAIVRTISVRDALICILAAPDQFQATTALLDSIVNQIPWRLVSRPAHIVVDSFLKG